MLKSASAVRNLVYFPVKSLRQVAADVMMMDVAVPQSHPAAAGVHHSDIGKFYRNINIKRYDICINFFFFLVLDYCYFVLT